MVHKIRDAMGQRDERYTLVRNDRSR